MKANDPFKKNVRFGIGVFFTVLEGLLSACVYMAIYLLLNMLLNNTVTIEHLNNLTFLIIGFFYRPADYLWIWIYTRANWRRSCIQANPSLFR